MARATLLERAESERVRPTVGEIRDAERAGAWQFNWPGADLPNPVHTPEVDRTWPQPRDAKHIALGFNPDGPRTIADLQIGDAGNSGSEFRRVQIYHLLAPFEGRTALTPYSNAIALATFASSNQRPRYLHCSLFATGFSTGHIVAPAPPLTLGEIESFAGGISASAAPASAVAGVPPVPTVQFRVLVQDESGGRYFDVDVLGARSFNFYAFSVTVFVLIKEGGYQVDPMFDVNEQEALGPGQVENAIVGARIVPVFQNQTQNTELRTVTIAHPGPGFIMNVPVPPGARKVQVFNHDGPAVTALYDMNFSVGSPFGIVDAADTRAGALDFSPTAPSRTPVLDIPNASIIRFSGAPLAVPTQFSIVYEVVAG